MARSFRIVAVICLAWASVNLHAQSPGTYSFGTLANLKSENTARFYAPRGLAIGPDGTIYVGDYLNYMVRKVTPSGDVTTLPGIFIWADGVAVDSSGTIYVASYEGVRKIAPSGTITSLAGSTAFGYVNGNGSEARFSMPTGIAVGADGTVYVVDGGNCAIRKVTAAGTVTTLAGPLPPTDGAAIGSDCSGFADGAGSAARFARPAGVQAAGMAIDAAGNLFVADAGNSAIRKITPAGVVTTVARAPQADLANPAGIAIDGAGMLYVADIGDSRIKTVSQAGVVTIVAGSAIGSADGTGTSAQFDRPSGIAVDASGTIYVADSFNHTIRKITSAGVVTTLAGKAGQPGSSEDGIGSPGRITGIAVDDAHLVYASDRASHRILRITSSGSVTTFAGSSGTPGSADSMPRFHNPAAVAVGRDGALYIADELNHTIRKITASGAISTVAGAAGISGSVDGSGTKARFDRPSAIAIDSAGSLYVTEVLVSTIRKITPDGNVTTFAGQPRSFGTVDGVGSSARFAFALGLAIDAADHLYVADFATVRKVTPAGVVTTLTGIPGTFGSTDGPPGTATLRAVALSVNASGTIYVADLANTIRSITPDGVVTTLAGTPDVTGTADGTGSAAQFYGPQGIVVDASGTLTVADTLNHRIRRVTPSGVVTTIAGGNGNPPFGSADGQGTTATFFSPRGIAIDSGGTLHVADSQNHTIRMISPHAMVSTQAGIAGQPGSTDGAGSDARFSGPVGVAASGRSILVADTGNHTIRSIRSDSVVSTLAGLATASGSADGQGRAARFSLPQAIAFTAAGGSVVADTSNHTIRAISPAGAVSTLAGLAGSAGSANGLGSDARFNAPQGVAVAGDGTIFVADTGNHTIRLITTAGVVSTLAGAAGSIGSADGTGSAARFSSPRGIAVDGAGTVFVADTGNHTLRAITTTGAVSTIGGAAGTSGSTDGAGGTARFNAPHAVAVDSGGTLYIADTGNDLIRQGVSGTPIAPSITTHPSNQAVKEGGSVQFTVTATGNPAPGFQWQMFSNGQWTSLADDGVYRDTATPTLTIVNVPSTADGARFRCIASSSAGTSASTFATLTLVFLRVNPSKVQFGATQGALTPTSPGPLVTVTSPQSVAVAYNGPEAFQWVATASQPWVTITNGSGTGNGRFIVSIESGFPFMGYQEASITVASQSLGMAVDLRVGLAVRAVGDSSSPQGVFDTPLNGATGVSGSIAVTGWAVDDIEVDRVEIWRDLAQGEATVPFNAPGHPGHGKVFIANTLFVSGARPDIETFGLPLSHRAGWGYLLLTWGLWNQGNGRFNLYAIAFDVEGNSKILGMKTITASNQTAIRPFGSVDTPTYGQTVSGTIWNYGWALTPNANSADPRSCTITNGNVFVAVDSGPLVPVTYAQLRTDIATSFPGFSNGSSAGGAYSLDTTTLTNGTHQIGWYVVDSCGRADGIGSRFFTVQN